MPENYVLKIKIDDTDLRKLEKRLAGIMTGAGSSSSKSGGGMANAGVMKSLAKLGIISAGIIGLLAVTKKLTAVMIDSSPMLQQMLKLMNFSIMLIFRPIGDFIGFLLRRFIIPWYKDVYPVMKRLGTTVGNAITTVGQLLFPANEDAAITAGKLVAILAGGIIISVKSAKAASRLIVKRIPGAGLVLGRNAGNVFNSKVNKGALANLKTLKPKGMNSVANKIISAFRMFNRIKFPTIPKPTWMSGFSTSIDKLVNLMTGGGGGKTGSVSGSGTSVKPSGTVKSGTSMKGHGKPPSWIKKFSSGGGGSAGGIPKGGGSSLKMKLGGIRGGGSGGLAFFLSQFMDYVPFMPELRDITTQGMWDMTGGKGIDGTGIDEFFANLFNNSGSKTTNVVVNIASIPDKATADYLTYSLQSGLNK